ncbi:MAG: tetratricopeptide repeat protein, partial [Bacteroidetes bacterium]|nr:tetratricopeptide repeat protein [Bacteroidota bacterium]
IFPKNEQLYFDAAMNYTSAKNVKRALKTLDNLRSRYGNSPDLVLYRYDVLLKACPTSKMGIELLEKSILEFPNDPGILSYLVDYYMTNENYSKGTEFLEQLVLADETNALACLLLGDITFEAGKKDLAFAYYKKALKGEGLNVKTIAETFVKMKEIWLTDSEMSTLMDACERDWPRESLIFALLGDYYYAQKNLLRTIYYYKKAVELNPDLNAIWNQLLLLEFEVEDWPSLKIDGSKVIELFPLSPLGYYMSGTAMNRLGEYSLAKSILEEGIFFVLNDDQLKGEFKAQLAESYFGVQDVKAGLKLYDESIRLSPNNNYILNLYFKSTIFKLKDPEKARELYEMLIVSEMNENRKKESLALLSFVEKKFKEAFNVLESIEQSYFRYLDVLELQGDVLFFLDKKVEAKQKWQEAKTRGKKSSVLEQKLTTGIYYDPL